MIEEVAERPQRLACEISLIIVEQHVELALRVADYACVLDRGTVALDGPWAEIRDDPLLVRDLAPQDCYTADRNRAPPAGATT